MNETYCHCLCGHNHPGVVGVCSATADTAVTFAAEITGPRDVPMCSACAAATLAMRREASHV